MADFLGIPDVIWSGAIGSTLTLLGVAASNWSNTSRLKRQLKHDAKEKIRQRKAEIRKAVYLEAAEEFVKANAHLGGLIDLKPGINPASGTQSFNAAAAKALLVCDVSSLNPIGDLQIEHAVYALRCIVKAQPIRDMYKEIDIHQRVYDSTQVEIARILSAMTALNENGIYDPEAMSRLNKSIEIQQNLAKQSDTNKTAAERRKATASIEYLRFASTALASIGDKSTAALIAMRRELEIDEDRNAVEGILNARNKTVKRRMADVMEEIFPGFNEPVKLVSGKPEGESS